MANIVKADKFLGITKKAKVVKFSAGSKNVVGNNQKLLLNIEKKVISVDKLLKNSLLLQRKDAETKRRKKEDKTFEEKEKDLEKKQPRQKGKFKLPSLPKLGLFDTIKNFIVNVFLGFLAVRLIDFLPQLLKILPVIIKVSDFIVDIAGKMLDGLITIIDWGYKAIDATRGFIGKSFGDDALKNFDKLGKLVDTFLNLAIIAGMLSVGTGDTGPGFSKGKRGARPKPGERFRPKVTESGGRRAGSPFDVRNPFRERPTITEGRGGRSGFRLPEFLGGKPRAKVTVGGSAEKGLFGGIFKGGSKAAGALKFAGRGLEVAALIPTVFEVVGLVKQKKYKDAARTIISAGLSMAVFESVLGLTGAAALAEEIFSGGIATPAAIATLFGGVVGAGAASAGAGYVSDELLKKLGLEDKTEKMAGGGPTTPSTRGGKRANAPVTRYIGGKKSARTISITPRKVKPGSKVGGKDKLEQIFPDTKNPSGNIITKAGSFIGNWISSLFGGGSQPSQDKKPKVPEKAPNPLGFLVKASDTLGKADFFGPIFTLATKTLLGDKPGKLDYLNVGIGLNSWLNQTMNFGGFAFAEGGEVDAKNFMIGQDYSNVIAKSVENSVSGEVNQSIQDLMKQLMIQPVSPEEEPEAPGPDGGGGGGGGGEPSGPGLTAGQWGPLLDVIRSTEGSWESISGKKPIKGLTGWTIGDIAKSAPSFAGAYQLDPRSVIGWAAAVGLNTKDKFTPENQNKIAIGLIEGRAKGSKWIKNEISDTDFGNNLATIWAGLPVLSDIQGKRRGSSYYSDVGWNKANTSPENVEKSFKKVKKGGYSREEIAASSTKNAANLGNATGNLSASKQLATSMGLTMTSFNEGYPGDGVHATNSLHYKGRAMDFSDGVSTANEKKFANAMIQKYGSSITELIHTPLGYGIANGKKVPLSYWGDSTNRQHYNHVHVAFGLGGRVRKPTTALVGEKGPEFIFDADTTSGLDSAAPGLLEKLNFASTKPQIASILQSYAPYETGAESVVVMPDINIPANASQSSGGSGTPIISGGSVNRDMQFEDTLMYG